MEPLRIHLFGHVRLVWNDTPVKLMNPGRTVPLLAYLLLHREQPLKRNVLAQTLWPDLDDDAALASLRRNLFRIEKSLPALKGGRWLDTDGLSVRWNESAPARIDVDEFARLCETDGLDAAVALYAGDLAEGLHDEWLLGPRERYRSDYLTALLRLVNRSRSSLQHAQAISYARRLLSAEPLREDVLRQLMLSRYESGDGPGALRDYREFAALLRSELDIAPMPETEATRELVVRGVESAKTAFPGERDTLSALRENRPTLPLVGRSEEMGAARSAWDRAARGAGGILFISGEAGIGKSRLVRELGMLAQSQGARVLLGSTSSPESAPYQAIVEAFRSALPLVETIELKSAARDALALLVPELREGAPAAPEAIESEAARLALLDAAALTLQGLAKPRPVLVILEDLHWAGAATITALEYLTRRVARTALLLVATYRDEEVRAHHPLRVLRREFQQQGFGSHIAPNNLSIDAIEELVLHRDPATSAPGETARIILAQTAGNPLFITEALGQVAPGNTAAISGLRDMIAARVALLSEDARHLLELASVIGAGFTIEVLRDSIAWPEARVLEHLSDLLDHRFVRETGTQHRYDFTFAHHVILETVYESIPPKVRSRRHHRVAGVLEREATREDAAASIAHHWAQALELERAAAQYLRAARRASRLFANEEALDFTKRGLAGARDAALRCGLLDVQIGLLQRARDRSEQRASIDEYLSLAAGLRAPAHHLRALLYEIEYERAQENAAAEDRALEALYALARAAKLPGLRVEALLADAKRQNNRSHYDRAEVLLKKALSASARAGLREMELRALGGLLDVALDLDRVEDTDLLLARAQAITPPQDSTSRLMILLRAARCAQLARRDEECYTRADEYLQLARTTGDRQAEAQALRMKALAASRIARFDECEAGFGAATALFEEIGDARGQAYCLHEHATVIGSLGFFEESAALFRRALAIFEKLDWVRGRMFCLFNLSATYIGARNFSDGLVYANQALHLSRTFPNPGAKATSLRNIATAQSGLGEDGEATQNIEQAIAIQRTVGDTGDLPFFLAEGARIFALAGDAEVAMRYAHEAIDVYRSARAGVLSIVEVLWACALATHLCGDAEAARTLVAEAAAYVLREGEAITSEAVRARWVLCPPASEILRAHERGEWPATRASVSLSPSAIAPPR